MNSLRKKKKVSRFFAFCLAFVLLLSFTLSGDFMGRQAYAGELQNMGSNDPAEEDSDIQESESSMKDENNYSVNNPILETESDQNEEETSADAAEESGGSQEETESLENSRIVILELNGGNIADSTGWTTMNEGQTYTCTLPLDSDTTDLSLPVPKRTGYTFGGWKKPDGKTLVFGNGIEECYLDFSEIADSGLTLSAVWQKYSLDITKAVYQLPENMEENTISLEYEDENGAGPDLQEDILPLLNEEAATLLLDYTISYVDESGEYRTVTRTEAPISIEWNWSDDGWTDGTNPMAMADFREVLQNLESFDGIISTICLSDGYLKQQIALYESSLPEENGRVIASMSDEEMAFSDWGVWNGEKQIYEGEQDAWLTSLKLQHGQKADGTDRLSQELAEGTRVITLEMNGGGNIAAQGWMTGDEGKTYTYTADASAEKLNLPIPKRTNYTFGGWKKPNGTVLVYGNGITSCSLDLSEVIDGEMKLTAVWQKYSIDIKSAVYELPFDAENNTLDFFHYNENGEHPDLQKDILPFLNTYANQLTLNYKITYNNNGTSKTVTRNSVTLTIDWSWQEDGWEDGTNPKSPADFRWAGPNLESYNGANTWVRLNDHYLKGKIAEYEKTLTGSIDSDMKGEDIFLSDWGTWDSKEQFYSGKDSTLTVFKMNLGFSQTDGISGNEQYLIDTVSPSNVTLNLFDYWILGASYIDDHGVKPESRFYASGVNKEHALIFRNAAVGGLWNVWTGKNGSPREDIVKNVLNANGYPDLNIASSYNANGSWGSNNGIYDPNENLSYLFEPGKINNGNEKNSSAYGKAYENVKGLFKISEDGNYYFSSHENYAEYDHSANSFNVYETWGVSAGGSSPNGQFFPFNPAGQVFTIAGDGSLTQKKDGQFSIKSTNSGINHYLGMTMEVDFQQPVGGMVSVGTDAKPMKFTFSGDDDVWIFIDDVLVADLGGIHDEAAVEIDFSTGEILSYLASNPEINKKRTTLKSMFEEADKGYATNFNGNTFASNTTHTLKMFYLERGNTDSNLTLSFNLMEPAQSEIVKLDQNGKPVANVKFDLFKAQLDASGKPILDKTGNHYVVEGDSIIGDTPTDSAGRLILPGDYDYSQHSYYVLRESDMPKGYFQPGDILLRYDKYQKHADGSSSGTNLLHVDNRWTTGATGNFTANVYQSGTLNYDNEEYGIIDSKTGQAGLILAIPVMKDTTGAWLPLYGSNMTGFNSVKYWTDGATTADNQRKALLEAVLYQIYATEYVDPDGIDYKFREWYLEWDPDNSRYQGTLTDLPGEASRYYWASHSDDADLSMAYYFLDLNELSSIFGDLSQASTESKFEVIANKISDSANGSTEEDALINAVKGLVREIENLRSQEGIPPFALLDVSKFNRVFSSRIYVANVQPRLMVQKLDQDDNPIAGAEFTLYSDQECENKVASGITDDQGLLRFSHDYDAKKPAPGGAAMVFTGQTKYWLKETKAPDRYNGNLSVVPVYVTENGRIYADALKANDGVTVKKGLGKLLQTMVRYAGGGDVNATLRDIEARLFVVDTWDKINDAIVVGRENPSTEESLYLHYGLTNALMEYGTHEINGVAANPYFEVDEDIAGINVEQNYAAHEGESLYSTVALKTNLKDTNIRTLFTGSTTVVMRNREKGSLGSFSIKKTVSGSDGDIEKTFAFGVEIGKGEATETIVLDGEYSYTVFQQETEETLETGTIAFTGDETNGWIIQNVKVTDSGSDASNYVKKDNEEWSIYLKHNQVFKVAGIPFHLLVTATEKDRSGYQTTVSVNGGSWKAQTTQSGIVEEPIGNPYFVFNNHRDKVTNLTVKKIVTKGGETEKGFPFTIKLYDATGAAPLQGIYQWKIVDDHGNEVSNGDNGQAARGEITKGVLTVYLKDTEKVVIQDIPIGGRYMITETTMGYRPSVTVNGENQQVVDGSVSGIITERRSDDNASLPTEIEYTNTRSGSITITKRTGTGTLLSGAGFTLYIVDEKGDKTVVADKIKTSLAMRHDLVGNEEGFDQDSMRYNSGTASYIVHKTKEGDQFFYYRFLTDEERRQYYDGILKDKEKVEAVVQFKELDLAKTYAIEETIVPEGYMQNAAIAESMGDIKLGAGSEGTTAVYDVLYTVTNHEKMILPTTGLAGIARFLGIGTALIAAAVVLWQMRRQKQPVRSKQEKQD